MNANGKSPRGLRRYVERRDASSAARYETRKYAIFPATSVGFLEAKTTIERLLESVARPQKAVLVNEDNGEKESAEEARKAKERKKLRCPERKIRGTYEDAHAGIGAHSMRKESWSPTRRGASREQTSQKCGS